MEKLKTLHEKKSASHGHIDAVKYSSACVILQRASSVPYRSVRYATVSFRFSSTILHTLPFWTLSLTVFIKLLPYRTENLTEFNSSVFVKSFSYLIGSLFVLKSFKSADGTINVSL